MLSKPPLNIALFLASILTLEGCSATSRLAREPSELEKTIDSSMLWYYASQFEDFRLGDVDGDSAEIGLKYSNRFYRNVDIYSELDTLGNNTLHFSSLINGNRYKIDIFSSRDIDSVVIEERVKENVRGTNYWHSYTQRESKYFADWNTREGLVETESTECTVKEDRGFKSDTVRFIPTESSRKKIKELIGPIIEKTNHDIRVNNFKKLSKMPGFMGRKHRN